MASLETLKHELRRTIATHGPVLTEALSDQQYRDGFQIFTNGPAYATFIIPQLHELFSVQFQSCRNISVLEIGPGSKSVLGQLLDRMRKKIGRYVAVEHNKIYVDELKQWLFADRKNENTESENAENWKPLPGLRDMPTIHEFDFDTYAARNIEPITGDEKFDLILFCHSMYGMKHETNVIRQALKKLAKQQHASIVVFHRQHTLTLDGLTCRDTKAFPTGTLAVEDND
jgi:SAM-dependent methyltransferase